MTETRVRLGRTKGIILDRDGTLIDVVRDEETGTVHVAFHPRHLALLPGVAEGLVLLAQAGYLLSVATNQPGPAKGQWSVAAVARTNQALTELLRGLGVELAGFEVCLHHPHGGPGGDPLLIGVCSCRKPHPGMLVRTLKRLSLDPDRVWMIGDSRVDLEAARAAGVRSALVFPLGRCELCPLRGGPPIGADLVRARFDEVVREILEWDERLPG